MADSSRRTYPLRWLAYPIWCFVPLAGLIGGYYLAVVIGLTLFPKSNLGPLPFIFTVWPLTVVGSVVLAVWLGLKAWRKEQAQGPGDQT